IKIFGGNSEFKINCMKASEYPKINFESGGNEFIINSDTFKEIIDQTAFACSEKDTRPVLTGVNFKCENSILKVNATDSYRLASKTISLDNVSNFDITIPSKYLIDVYHSLEDKKDIKLKIDTQKISFAVDNILIQTRLLDDQFPDTSKLIPSTFTQILKVNGKELNSAIDRASFIKSDGKNIVKLSINSEKVDITANNQTSSSFETIKAISFEGNPFEISCSGKYLQDAISSINYEEITISFSGDLKPMIITCNDDPSIIQLISPVRTYR
ncbi:MAG: DNA polymerase III subunit beta, partial [Methanobacteriaceae archaeon]|nr:DNA polymerase III subunit beta [Methanobacteriaceae archaeon]